jgi:thiol:disulfide interchange protein DsbA
VSEVPGHGQRRIATIQQAEGIVSSALFFPTGDFPMLRRLLAPVLFLASLSACAQPASPPAAKPAARPAATAAARAPAAAARPAAAATPATAARSAPRPVAPSGPAPRLGVDYEVMPSPQPTYGQGKIEVAEVFSYRCIHCAEFQPQVNIWKKTMPADVRWEYVPGVFGGSWDDFARAYFAAEIMGVQKRTHDAVFKGVFVDQLVKTGSQQEIADMYGRWGVNPATFLSTMQSFGVTAKLNRAKQFALRTGVTATPTLIVAGKYRLNVTQDRGFPGMLSTLNYVIGLARADAAAGKSATAPARTP